MARSLIALTIIFLISTSSICAFLGQRISPSANSPLQNQSGGLSFSEQQIVALVNGSRTYDYALALENTAFNHCAFRASGSAGANESANWIKEQFESFGLDAWLESFEFMTWDLLSKPSLVIDEDGDQGTTSDQTVISSFQCEHYSWSTPMSGVFADLVVLPLPEAANPDEIGMNPIDMTAWNSIDTSGKVLAIGKEVLMPYTWRETYIDKLRQQPPAAVIYLYWYDWRSSVPRSFGSSAGKPLGAVPNYYWDLEIPVGSVSYGDSVWIRNRETAVDVSVDVSIRSVISNGDNYNVVGRIVGYDDPEKLVIISGHYDTVMCGGFGDNGAGTAGVVELAGIFAEAVREGMYRPNYTLLFVAFTGEELGLVGSANYVRQHKSEMANIVAVLNLDCIGSDDLYITETDAANGFDLDETILVAAQDLGVPAASESPGGSDQETFRDPAGVGGSYYWFWKSDAGISDALPVNSSTLIISNPIFYDPTGVSGWIHTENDNSTSTQTLSWIEADDLQNQLKVTALSVVRVSPNTCMLIDASEYVWSGDFVVNETALVLIKNCNFTVENGEIYVNGTLNVENSTICMRHTSKKCKSVFTYGNFSVSNSRIVGNNRIVCFANSNVLLSDSSLPKTSCNTYRYSTVQIRNSTLSVSFVSGGNVILENSKCSLYFDFSFLDSTLCVFNSNVTYAYLNVYYEGDLKIHSGFVESLTLYNQLYCSNFTLSGSTVEGWDIICNWLEGRLLDSVLDCFEFVVDPLWSGTITLPLGYTDYLELNYATPPLIIENSTINEWRISSFGDSLIELLDSENIDLDISGNAQVSILNSSIPYLCVYEDFTGSITATNSSINSFNIRFTDVSLDLALKEGLNEFFNLYIPERGSNVTLVNSSVDHWWIDACMDSNLTLSNSALTKDLIGWCPYNLKVLSNSLCLVYDSNLEAVYCAGSILYQQSPTLTLVNCTVSTLYAYSGANVTIINSTVNMLITDPACIAVINSRILLQLDFSFEMTAEDAVDSSLSEDCDPLLPEGVMRFSQYVNITAAYDDYFSTQVKVCYNETEVSEAGLDESRLRMFLLNDSEWQPCSLQGVNAAENYVWANVTRFSTYVLGTIMHNIAITETALSKTVVGQGYDVKINVSTFNEGVFTETFNLTAYANEAEIGTVEVTLESDSSATVCFVWNTTGFARGNYTVNVYAWPVTGEGIKEDNVFSPQLAKIAIPGDVNGDDVVELFDFFITSQAFGSTPDASNWNPNADINGDNMVELMDFWIMSQHFGEGA